VLAATLLLFWQLPELWSESSTSPSNQVSNRARLAAAASSVRPLRGRLSGGFPHAANLGDGVEVEELSGLGREIERAARSRSPRALADLGVLQLLAGQRGKARAALEAAARGSRDPSILSDLAALLLDTLPPSERIRALDVARQAAAAGPDLVEAQCNFALALDEFGLVDQAKESWARCRDLDDGLGWRPEVERRLDLLQRPTEAEAWEQALPLVQDAALRGDSGTVRRIANRFRQRARLHVEEIELPAWATAVQEGRPAEASRHLLVARTLGQALRSINGDALLTEAVAVIDEAKARGDGDRLRLLAEGHSAYRRGLDFFLQRENDKVVAEFERAAEAFHQARSPFRGWAVFGTQFYRFMAGAPGQEILPVMQALGAELSPLRHRILEARRLTLMGMAHVRLAHFAESFHLYQDALRLFAEVGEREHLASLHYMLGENFRLQGDMAGAWEGYLQAFPLLRDIGPSVFFRNTLMEAAITSLRQGLPATSLLFHEEGVRLAEARADENPLGMSEALLRRSSAHLTLGELEEARRDLEESRAHAERIAPGRWRDRLLADLDFALGELELKAGPERALIPLSAALDASLQSQMRYRLPLFYETRARAFLASGDEAQARADLERGVAEIEAQRATALADPRGAAAFEQARSLFDAMVDLESRRGHPAVAFEYAERVRARSLLDMADSTGEARVLGIEEAQRELPPGIALVEFAVLKDRTLAWVVTDESCELVTLRIGEQPLESLVKELRSAILGGGNARPPGIRLYGLLIQPLQPWIGGRDLIVVPDRSLHLLPFAALVDPATRRYLLEERAVAKAPSATLWVKALQRDRILAQGALPGVLVAGDPAFDRDLFTGLPSLPEAEKEAREVADVHTGARLLVGEQATKRAFLDEALHSSVIHLAAHARSSRENPLISALLLAREGNDPGVLYAYEIYRMRFAATRLVVLSACGTAGGKVSASEGVGSLARAFLAAGVPAVVGSLWDTQDKAASDVLIAFHRRLKQGEDPLSALRGAQLDVLRRPNPETPRPDLWAGFELIGGVSPR
jgi:CHAT domain-containing protein